jgi:hypothetical protein
MKLLTLILAMLVSVSTQIVSAQEPSPFYWEFIHVEIDVQENGDMLVTETQKYVFTASYTNKRYRWLPLDKVDHIENVEVFEGDRKLSVTTGNKKNQQWIRWQHALNPPESHTFVIKYRVKGGLQIDNSEDKVYWKAIFKERAAPILSGKVTVRLPAILAKKIRNFKSFGVPAKARQIDTRTFEFVSRGAMPAGEEMEVLVTFPHGLLDVPLPKSKGIEFLRLLGLLLLAFFILRFFEPLIFLVILAIAVSLLFSGNNVLILIGLVLLLVVIVVWWLKWYVSNQVDTTLSDLKVSDQVDTAPSEVQPWEKRLLDELSNEFEIYDQQKISDRLESLEDNIAQERGEVLYSRELFTKNPAPLKVSDKIGTLPSNLPAPAVSFLLSHKVGPDTVLAMIVEMCQRGSLTINVKQKGRWNKRQNITKHDTSSVQPWEKRLLDALPNEFEISELHEISGWLKSSVDNLAQELGEVLYSRGLFTKNPAPSWSDSGEGLLFLFSSFLVFGFLVSPGFFIGFFILLFMGNFLFAIKNSLNSLFKLKPTSAGLREINQWRAFKEQVIATEEFSIAPTTDEFYSYLPYAIALGVADFWFYQAEKAKIPAPVWFRFSGNGDDIPSSIFLDTIEVRQALNSVREAFSGG